MRIAIARERQSSEARVALVPEVLSGLVAAGYEVALEPGAGKGAMIPDDAFEQAGGVIDDRALWTADLVVSVQPLEVGLLRGLRSGTATLSFFPANQRIPEVIARRELGITTFAMEYVPRISRAQSMDALTSQAMVTGYRGAIVAAGLLRQFFPLSMTAAGTIPPAQVVVLGAGVAGLQAIATCRRLGAVVKGYDVRAAAAEEIRSMGAIAIDLELPTLEGAGGYAREMTEERAAQQRERLTPYLAAADALITTAAVPGRRAPVLVTRSMVEHMKAGSVVIDLAADSGGNVEDVTPGKVVRVGQAQIWGGSNVPSQMPGPASRLFAQNVRAVIALMTSDGAFVPDFADEIVAAMCVTTAGEIRHEPTARLLVETGVNAGE
ncbi:MAG TPA: NAD(P) transhydrogenase subunit alpha [Propionibacteriaceae bacterium]|nr:NAD(P) transhydrogenase subunit alpha [Propionibacteriaceae bacterium]